jgi:putative transcriptional regulator
MKPRKHPRKNARVATRIIQGLTELADALERGEPLEKRFTVRTVEVAEPSTYTPPRIRQTRLRLHASQAIFAEIVGVSVKLVEHWESGLRTPSAMARRLLDEINENPDHWRRKLRAA